MSTDLVGQGEELVREAGRMAGELVNAGRLDLAEWPLALAQRVYRQNTQHQERLAALDRQHRRMWWRCFVDGWRFL